MIWYRVFLNAHNVGNRQRYDHYVILFNASTITITVYVLGCINYWLHSGFNINNSVTITAGDTEGLQQLVSHISRCPFSLARMIKVTEAG